MDVDCRQPNAASVPPDTVEHAHDLSSLATGAAAGRGRIAARSGPIATL